MAVHGETSAPPGPATLGLDGRPLATYVWRPELPAALSPRPYVHPVRTLAGTVVTESMPASHRHHLGVGVAVPSVAGANFWGGRTFVPGHGPAWLDNHGTQQHDRWLRQDAGELGHTLRWVSHEGGTLLRERRRLACLPAGPSAWALDMAFTLTNATAKPVDFASPAVLGRVGAGFGGFFWRAAFSDRIRVFGSAGDGLESVHGRPGDWVALSSPQWTLVFSGGSGDCWFVRARDYVAVGSSLAWDTALCLEPGAGLERRIVTVVADGPLTPRDAAAIALPSPSGPVA
jgi:hypothetical protein